MANATINATNATSTCASCNQKVQQHVPPINSMRTHAQPGTHIQANTHIAQYFPGEANLQRHFVHIRSAGLKRCRAWRPCLFHFLLATLLTKRVCALVKKTCWLSSRRYSLVMFHRHRSGGHIDDRGRMLRSCLSLDRHHSVVPTIIFSKRSRSVTLISVHWESKHIISFLQNMRLAT